MFKNNLTPPPPQSPSHNIMFKPNTTMFTVSGVTADDATMNVISWNHAFPSQNPF